MKIQIHSMELLLVSNNAKIRALQVEESKEHDQSSLHHARYDQHGVYIPMTKISEMCLLISTKLVNYRKRHTFGSSGGSNCTIQSTAGISKPRAATSVHRSVPDSALQNWKNVVVRLVCFCLPCKFTNICENLQEFVRIWRKKFKIRI